MAEVRVLSFGCGSLMLIVTIAFIILKAAGTISWPWLLVLSPLMLWGLWVLVVLGTLAFVLFMVAWAASRCD